MMSSDISGIRNVVVVSNSNASSSSTSVAAYPTSLIIAAILANTSVVVGLGPIMGPISGPSPGTTAPGGSGEGFLLPGDIGIIGSTSSSTSSANQGPPDAGPRPPGEGNGGTRTEDHGPDTLMEPWAYVASAVTLFFIGFFGFFLNLFVIALMCKDVQLWTPMNIILFNLVCSDFSVSIIGNPFTLTSAISHRWIFGAQICVAYGFFMSLLGITSITTLTVLSYERFCLISYPFSSRNLSRRGALLAVLFIWSYSFALTSPPLFGWGAYVHEAANISCSVNWESQTWNATTYIIFLFLFGLVVPLVVIVYSYTNILISMKQVRELYSFN
ncbi:opsin-3-like [Uranotaenia lowii]|uniref:opsin-3-like n=1 Tax=Uranotaenia lowii TaxID=190385 RepID=UPI00247892AF|nr:opsin-3-like [Uranotaenia lowii]